MILKHSASVVALLSAFLNLFLLLVMCKNETIRKKSVNCFTFTVIVLDLLYGGWLCYFNYLVRRSKENLEKFLTQKSNRRDIQRTRISGFTRPTAQYFSLLSTFSFQCLLTECWRLAFLWCTCGTLTWTIENGLSWDALSLGQFLGFYTASWRH